ncbi:MAG TPA: RNA polymerase sigma factor [Terriglobales bacterium]|nr:RNA polymerase sigma factor [Terriglobales bacterium]
MHLAPFFTFEDLKVVAGQVIVDDAMVLARTEEDQLELAVRQHAQLVYRIAYSVLRNHHDAEDATQETFVRVLRAKRKLSKVDDPQKWLARIAWRVAVDRRKNLPEVPLEITEASVIDEFQSQLISSEQSVLGQEMMGLVQSLITALPVQLRDALTLSTVQELSPAEIAGVLEMSEAAVRSRIYRARQILKEKLEALLEGNHGT